MQNPPSEIAQSLADLFSLANVLSAAIVFLIILVYVRSRLRIHIPLKATAEALKEATHRIQGLSSDTPDKVFPHGPERLRNLWREFLEQRDENTVGYRGQQVSTLDPSDIFHDQALFGASNRQLAGTLAGIFTGIGIFGTFVGLVIGLAQVNPTDMIESVGSLLGGMWTAFLTSLFGIGTSLLWLYMDRKSQDAVRDAVQGFFIRVRGRYPVEGADRLLHRLLAVEQEESAAIHESKDILAEQKGIIQSLSTDLALAFQTAVTESLETALGPQLQKMTEAVESLAVNMGDRQVAALDQMVETFQSRLSEQLHGQLEGLARGLEQASEWQERVHGELGTLVERVETASERQIELIEAASLASESFVGSLEHLLTANERLQETAGSISAMAVDARAAAEAIAGESENLQERTAALNAENDVFREANEQIRLQLAQQIESLEGKVEEIQSFWTKVGQDLETAGEQLKSGANEFGVLASEKLGEIFNRFDSEMAKVVEHLSGTLAEIREVTDELPAGLADLRSALTSQADELRTSGETIEKALEHLQKLEGIPEAMERLGPLSGSIDAAVDRFGGASTALDQLAVRVSAVPASLHEFLHKIREREENGTPPGNPPAAQEDDKR